MAFVHNGGGVLADSGSSVRAILPVRTLRDSLVSKTDTINSVNFGFAINEYAMDGRDHEYGKSASHPCNPQFWCKAY